MLLIEAKNAVSGFKTILKKKKFNLLFICELARSQEKLCGLEEMNSVG
jgi:hypothetical protein